MESLAPNTIIAGILVLFVVLGFLKTFVRFFFNLIALGVGAVAGVWGYNNGFLIARKVVEQPASWMPGAVGVLAFVIGVCAVRMVLSFLSGKSSEDSQVHNGGFGLKGAAFGLLFGLAIAYFLLTGVRYAGTMAELKFLRDYFAGSIENVEKEPVWAKLKHWIDDSEVGRWHQQVDFINDPARENLAKLAVVNENKDQLGVATRGRPAEEILDALPVDESLTSSIEEGDFASVLRNKNLRESAKNNKDNDALLRLNLEKVLGIR